jgi:L-asparagine transporter-like permease
MFFVYSIFRYWKFGIILGLIMMIMYGMMMVHKKDKKIAELEFFIQEKVFYLQSLEDAVNEQNIRIEAMEEAAEMWESLAKEAQKKRAIIRKKEKEKIINIIESDSGKTCPEAMDWMIDQARKELKW